MARRFASLQDLLAALAHAHAAGQAIGPCDLSALGQVVEYTPEDMTVTVQGGITLAALQRELSQCRQWLPIDPPHPESLTISDLILDNRNGPRRCGYGTIRDHLIGLAVALADGRFVRSGGRVVKNVAGYDMAKLFVGSQGTLGLVAEATFKLLPYPETESLLASPPCDLQTACALLDSVRQSPITPVILDMAPAPVPAEPADESTPSHPSPRSTQAPGKTLVRVIAAFAGTTPQVDWQRNAAAALGFTGPGDLSHERDFWNQAGAGNAQALSILPTRLIEVLESLSSPNWIARAANGVIWQRPVVPSPTVTDQPRELMHRIKTTFDPKGVFPPLPW